MNTLDLLKIEFTDKNNRGIFYLSYFVAILSYSYIFFGSVYNNHDLPNSYYTAYPSFTTTMEGRFIGDILYQLQGGSAIPTLNMAIAVAIQIFNGILASKCLGITSYWAKLCLTTIITIHPAITDYYSWGGVSVNFCLADTFSILAVYYCSRYGLTNSLASIICIVFCAATYQPKVSIIATIGSLFLVSKLLSSTNNNDLKNIFIFAGKFIFIVIISGLIYYVILVNTIAEEVGITSNSGRLHVNSIAEFIPSITNSIEYTQSYFFSKQNFIHPNDYYIPFGTTVFFILISLSSFFNKNICTKQIIIYFVLFFFMLFMLLFSMNLVFLITTKAYSTDGRFFGSYAYVLAFFISYLIDNESKIISLLFKSIYIAISVFFIFDNAQYSYRGYMQNKFEYSFVTRIAMRVENIIQPQKKYKLVVLGNLPWDSIRSKLSRKNNIQFRKVIANYDQPGFIHYRRVEYLNFIMGNDIFISPDIKDIAIAKTHALSINNWPSTDSVFIIDDILVVVL